MWCLILLAVATSAEGEFEIYHNFSPPSPRPNPVFSYVFTSVIGIMLLGFLLALTKLKLNTNLAKFAGGSAVNYLMFALIVLANSGLLVVFWLGTSLLQVIALLTGSVVVFVVAFSKRLTLLETFNIKNE
mmetsp:Transcript_32915/g.57581  ORF Transcript_32915/g.57581 Transcript_32915/m.57581 type:complete len:130 (+) Transcript_32915:10678-11067(+)